VQKYSSKPFEPKVFRLRLKKKILAIRVGGSNFESQNALKATLYPKTAIINH